jgi:hypothetical protein
LRRLVPESEIDRCSYPICRRLSGCGSKLKRDLRTAEARHREALDDGNTLVSASITVSDA